MKLQAYYVFQCDDLKILFDHHLNCRFVFDKFVLTDTDFILILSLKEVANAYLALLTNELKVAELTSFRKKPAYLSLCYEPDHRDGRTSRRGYPRFHMNPALSIEIRGNNYVLEITPKLDRKLRKMVACA